jgi:hypothetical protein
VHTWAGSTGGHAIVATAQMKERVVCAMCGVFDPWSWTSTKAGTASPGTCLHKLTQSKLADMLGRKGMP